jgi:Dolichyl-phosphate-mannose-protein mannosyltransferase
MIKHIRDSQLPYPLAPGIPWILWGGCIARLLIAWGLPPGFDEAYYFLYTQHPDWSYFDHPLMVALTTGIGPWLTQTISPLTLRLGAMGLYPISTLLLAATGQHLFNPKVASIVTILATLAPLFGLGFGILASPDNGLIFFWSATVYLAAQEFFPKSIAPYQPTTRIVWIGLTLGLACLSKYHGFILALSLVGFCLCHPPYRRALTSHWFALSLLVFALTLTPFWAWNIQHDWISLGFHFSSRFQGGSAPKAFSPLNVLGVGLATIGFMFPSLGFPLLWVSWQQSWQKLKARLKARFKALTWQNLEPQSGETSFILWLGLPIALGFTLLGGWLQVYPAWPAPGLWTLSLLLALRASQWSAKTIERWLWSTAWVITTLLVILMAHITLGIFQKPGTFSLLGGWIAPTSDPSTTLIDVVQLRQRLQANPTMQATLPQTAMIITHEWWLSGYLDMAISPLSDVPVMALTPDPRGHAIWFHPADWLGQPALFISMADFDQSEIRETYAPYFRKFDLLDSIDTQRSGAVTETFYIYSVGELIHPYAYPY